MFVVGLIRDRSPYIYDFFDIHDFFFVYLVCVRLGHKLYFNGIP